MTTPAAAANTPTTNVARPDAPTALLILAKEPIPGRVKTRLSPPCTPVEAAELARIALVTTLDAAVRTVAMRPTLVLDGRAGPWLGDHAEINVIAQSEGGLADRIGSAFASQSGPTVLIGMDTPQVSTAALDEVIATLRAPGVDAVLGPTDDGGWWIIGLHDPSLPVFSGIPMSTSTTGAAQAARLRELGLRVATVATERDVDTFADARIVARRLPDSDFARAVAAVEATLRPSLRQRTDPASG